MATISSTQQPIVWAHNLDPYDKRWLFRSLVADEVCILSSHQLPKEDRDGYLIRQLSRDYRCPFEGCYARFNEEYYGPYRWDELPSLFENYTELCTSFFKYLADKNEGCGPSRAQYLKGMPVLLRYAGLDKYTLPALRACGLKHFNRYFLPSLLKAPSKGVTQELLHHAFANALLLLLGQNPSTKEPGIPRLILDNPSEYEVIELPEIAECYQFLSGLSSDKMEFMCTNFTEQLKELEKKILKLFKGEVSYQFEQSRLELIVQADVQRLLQNPHNPSSVKALSGEEHLLIERWIEYCFERVRKDKESRYFEKVGMLFELYYNLRTLPTTQKELLLQRNEELFTELEEYVLACICNSRIPSLAYNGESQAIDRERKLSQVGNTTLLNQQNNWLRTLMLGNIGDSSIPVSDTDKIFYETRLDTIIGKYWNLSHARAANRMPGVVEAGGDKNLPLVHGERIVDKYDTGESSDVSSTPVRGGFIKTEEFVPSPITNQGLAVKSDELILRKSSDSSSGRVGGGFIKTEESIPWPITNQGPAVKSGELETRKRLDASSGLVTEGFIKTDGHSQISNGPATNGPTATQAGSPTNTKNPISPSILQISFAIALVVISVVVVRYFMCGRSLNNALGIHHTSAAQALSEGAQI